MLKSLTNSKHKTIATCSSAALKNLTTGRSMATASERTTSKTGMPSLEARYMRVHQSDSVPNHDFSFRNFFRKRKNRMVLEIDDRLAETSNHDNEDNISEEEDEVRHHDSLSSIHSMGSGSVQSADMFRQQQHPLELSKSKKQIFVKPMQDMANESSFNASSASFSSQMRSGYERVMSPSKLVSNNSSSIGGYAANNREEDEVEEDERPTDYSLKFQEDVEDADVGGAAAAAASANAASAEVHEEEQENNDDVVKTFCTEGTPLDTPFLISQATSISDLRAEEEPHQSRIVTNKRPAAVAAVATSTTSNTFVDPASGMETPLNAERPKVYCTEGTPGVLFQGGFHQLSGL